MRPRLYGDLVQAGAGSVSAWNLSSVLDAATRADLGADELLPLVSFLWQLGTRRDARVPDLLDIVADGISASGAGCR